MCVCACVRAGKGCCPVPCCVLQCGWSFSSVPLVGLWNVLFLESALAQRSPCFPLLQLPLRADPGWEAGGRRIVFAIFLYVLHSYSFTIIWFRKSQRLLLFLFCLLFRKFMYYCLGIFRNAKKTCKVKISNYCLFQHPTSLGRKQGRWCLFPP